VKHKSRQNLMSMFANESVRIVDSDSRLFGHVFI